MNVALKQYTAGLAWVWTSARRSGILGKLLILSLMLLASRVAQAQYLGYSVDSANGTVSIFGIVTSDPTQANQDHLITTVSVGAGPVRVAVSPYSPTSAPTKVYVTNQGDNSLWEIDVSNLAKGQVTAQNVNVGSNPLELDQPDGIALAIPSSGINQGKLIAYVANLGNGTLSVIDTTTNTLVGSPLTEPGAQDFTPGTHIEVAADYPPSASALWVTAENSAGDGGLFVVSLATDALTDLDYGTSSQGVTNTSVIDGGGVSHLFTFIGFEGSSDQNCTGGACLELYDNYGSGGTYQPFINIPLSTSGTTVAVASPLTASNGIVTVYAADSNANLYKVTIDCSGSSCLAPVVSSPLPLNGSGFIADSLALTPDGALLYVSEPAGPGLQLVDAVNFCIAGTSGCTINQSVLSLTTPQAGLAIANVDTKSAPFEWFIGALPTAVPIGTPSLQINAIAMQNPSNGEVSLSLGFGSSNNCVADNSSTSSGSQCGASGTGEASISGQSSVNTASSTAAFTRRMSSTSTQGLPAGVVPITISGYGSGGLSSQTSNVGVGANCTLTTAETSVLTGAAITGNLSCLAPANDSLSGSISWGDGTNSPIPATATDSSDAATIPFTHVYTNPSSPTYQLSATVTDTTENSAAGTVTPASVTVTVTPAPPSCSLAVTPAAAQTGQTVTAGLTCTGIPGDTLSASVGWNDASSASIVTAKVSSGGTATIPITHTYSKAATYSVAASITDTTTTLVGTVDNSPVSVAITSAAVAPSCTLTATPTSVDTGQNVTETLACNATAGDALSTSIDWGDGTPAVTGSATVSSSGTAQVQLVHAYAAAGSFNISGTATDTTAGLAGVVTPVSVAITVSVVGPTITPGATSETVAEGQTAQYTLSFAGGTSEANVSFALACKTPLPTGVTCTFAPTSLTLDANGSGTAKLSIATTGPSTAEMIFPAIGKRTILVYSGLLVFPWFALLGLGRSRSRGIHKAGRLFMLLMVGLLAINATGCTGGGNSGSSPTSTAVCDSCTTSGTYSVVVTATSTNPAVTSTTTLQLIVMQ